MLEQSQSSTMRTK